MNDSKKNHYELEHFYPNVDRQKFWNLFVDHEAWSQSDLLPREITIIKAGKGHPQGEGAVRSVGVGSMTIMEDIVRFQPPECFRYATHNGSLPVNDFGGELFLEERKDGLLARYRGGFNPKYFGTGWLFQYIFHTTQKSVFRGLGKVYKARYGT